MEKPQHAHDCDGCTYLGRYKESDLYVCGCDTVIARWGSEGYKYQSGLPFVGDIEQLTIAAERAVEQNLLDPTQKTGAMGGETIAEGIRRWKKDRRRRE